MKEYFKLQYTLTLRHIRDFDLGGLVGFLLLLLILTAGVFYLFERTEYAGYVLLLVVYSLWSRLTSAGRSDFLKLHYQKKVYYSIRYVEPLLIGLPFALVLAYHGAFVELGIMLGLLLLMPMISGSSWVPYSIPTPFGQRPFEFPEGFRNSFYMLALAYVLAVIALFVLNFNMGLFALALVFLTVASYHLRPEREYFVWNFSQGPAGFLWAKIKTAWIYTTAMTLPLTIVLVLTAESDMRIIGLVYLLGCCLLVLVVLAKYAAYPREMMVPEAVMLALCIALPPVILLIGPYLYVRAKSQLKVYLP